jgi:dihydrofolate reductase
VCSSDLNDAYPHLRHLVVSTTLSDLPAPAMELVRGDPLETVRRVKVEHGLGIWLVGGGTLAHSLLPEIDRIVVKLNPWVIGDGIPMFAGGFRPTGFTVTATVPLPGGVQVITLERQR